MKPQSPSTRQPGQREVQALLDLLHAGRLAQAETAARALLERYPDTPVLHHVLANALAGQEKFAEAVESFRKLVAANPRSADCTSIWRSSQARLVGSKKRSQAMKNHSPAPLPTPFQSGHRAAGTRQARGGRGSYRQAVELEPSHSRRTAVRQFAGAGARRGGGKPHSAAIHPMPAASISARRLAIRKLGDAIASYRQALAGPTTTTSESRRSPSTRVDRRSDRSYRHALAIA
jgi:tetratricopeptide (TPR) repeat protein